MKSILMLVCLGVPVMIGCSQTPTSALQDQCSAGSAVACEELARTQRSIYQEQQANSDLDRSRPMIPAPASAIPPARHFP